MKREGRQHGMVRTYSSESKLVNPLTCRPTAGLFTKVSSKPTNHSKFTGKSGQERCYGCHMHPCHMRPTTKSKVKTKGSSKVRANDVSYKMLTWQVAEGGPRLRPGLKLSGFSATGILDLMNDDNYGYDHDYESYDEEEELEEEYIGSVVEEIVNIYRENDQGCDKEADGSHDDDDEMMGFYDVGMVIMMMDHVEEYDEDGWCLVEEMMT